MRISAVLLILLLAGCKEADKPFESPPLSDGSAITAQLYDQQDGGVDIATFELPKDSQEAILASLNGSHQDNHPMKWQVLADIEITFKNGSMVVNLFLTGGQLGAFAANGTYYRGASDSEFIRLLHPAKQGKGQQNGGGSSATPRLSP